MSAYTISENKVFSGEVITEQAFGINLVTSFDTEFRNDAAALDQLEELGVQIIRFPGGSVTEDIFTEEVFLEGQWSAQTYIDSHGSQQQMLTLEDAFQTAAHTNANMQLVIPTRVAFDESASQALASGKYGSRTEIDNNYLDLVSEYLDEALRLSEKYGVSLQTVEIGNEFWGSREMTASEYGYLAALLTEMIDESYPELEIIVQVAGSANKMSPRDDTEVYLEPVGPDDYHIHWEVNIHEDIPDNWLQGLIPGSGNAATQTRAIASELVAYGNAVQKIDGIVEHVYFDGGFDDIDNQRDYVLQTIESHFLAESGLEEIDYYVTEWSARNPRWSNDKLNLGNANGLDYAHTTVEAFFELVSSGVDSANFWPLTFGNPNTQKRTLIDTTESDLTFGGVSFQWLSQHTVGLVPVFDYEVDGEIDVHGFGNSSDLVFYVSERGGDEHVGNLGGKITLNLSEFIQWDEYYVTVTVLNSDDGSVDNFSANPVETFFEISLQSGGLIDLDISSRDLIEVRVQAVTSDGDAIDGSKLSDLIEGQEGNDGIDGGAGNDTIRGQFGNDTLVGGVGDDRVLGGWGDDIVDGSAGNDSLSGGGGDDSMFGGDGNDSLFAGDGADKIDAGKGNDLIQLSRDLTGSGSIALYLDPTDFKPGDVEFNSESGLTVYDTFVDGGIGNDTIRLSDTSEGFFFKNSGGPDLDRDGVLGKSTGNGQFANIEVIEMMGGDDLMDLTGAKHAFEGAAPKLSGGLGDDTIWSSDASDKIFGDDGDDLIYARNGENKVFGGVGNDEIVSGSGADTLFGDAGDDTIFGGSGFDEINGGLGDDSLTGGRGSDVLFGQGGSDTLRGGDGSDRLMAGEGADAVFGGDGNDLLKGGGGIDEITGGRGSDTLEGGKGDDKLFAGDGADLLRGGPGDDVLKAGRGDDILNGGLGDDTLWGMGKNDTFVFFDDHGHDTIMDFDVGNQLEQLDLSGIPHLRNIDSLGLGSGSDGAARQVSEGVIISTGSTSTILILDVSLSELGVENFIF